MGTPAILATLLALHPRMTGQEAGDAVAARLLDLWCEARAAFPEHDDRALRELLDAVQRGEPVEERPFAGLGLVEWELLRGLRELWPGLEVEDDGEWIEITLHPLGLYIFISREAAPPTGHSYSIGELE